MTRVDGVVVNYGYGNVSQLISATGYESDGVTVRGNENLGYTFDPAGNLLLRKGVSSGVKQSC